MTFSTLIENRAQSANVRHTQNVGFLCSTCWHHLPVQSNGLGTGYGSDNESRLHCYQCCGKRDREALKDRSCPFFAYVSSDGRSVSNWPGAPLGAVHDYAEHRTGWHGSTQARFRVRDVHGQWWSGRGPGRGMYCTLRPMKTPRTI